MKEIYPHVPQNHALGSKGLRFHAKPIGTTDTIVQQLRKLAWSYVTVYSDIES